MAAAVRIGAIRPRLGRLDPDPGKVIPAHDPARQPSVSRPSLEFHGSRPKISRRERRFNANLEKDSENMPGLISSCAQFSKKHLGAENYLRLKRTWGRTTLPFFRHDLTYLAKLYGSDKGGYHFYTQHYDTQLKHLRHKPLTILEIGVGGYDAPDQGGASLKMWKAYFPKARIFAIDIYDKKLLQEDRIKIFQGSQSDVKFLADVIREIGTPDIVIDDGSHVNEHVITSFNFLFPLLAQDGIYAIEDTQTSYWPGDHGGNIADLNDPRTSMGMLKRLADGINYEEFAGNGYEPTYTDKNIVSMHFYHNLVFVCKGNNLEGTRVGYGDPSGENRATEADPAGSPAVDRGV